MSSLTHQTVTTNSQPSSVFPPGHTNLHEPAAATQQRVASNQAMQRLLLGGAIQAKLTVNTPNDEYEQEADRVADHVMRMSAGGAGEPATIQRTCSACTKEMESQPIQRACKSCEEKLQRQQAGSGSIEMSSTESPGIQRMCDECEDELQRKEGNDFGSEISSSVESQIETLKGGGQQLPVQARSFFEPRFGRDFSNVRVHADGPAADTAQSVNALAYTLGNHIVFGSGQYQPNTPGGQRLLAHELTHVVQQGATKSRSLLQRQAILAEAPPGLDLRCSLIPDQAAAAGGLSILFGKDSSVFAPTAAERARLTAFINAWHEAGSFDDIQVQGFASADGPQGRNWTLSCERAEALRTELIAQGVSAARITTTLAHGASTAATTTDGNRRAVVSVIPQPRVRSSPVVSGPVSESSCPQSVSLEVSRGNDDQRECQYQDAVILATIVVDPCACAIGNPIPIFIRFHATLDGKSFANAAGTIRETQASTIGQRFFLQEEGTTNNSPTLVHGGDVGRPGDPDDTLDTEFQLLQTLDCLGASRTGRVRVTNGAFIQQILTWTASADSTGLQAADLNLQQRQVPGRVLPPLRGMGSPYPPFPGVPRDNRCTCHPVTGVHQGTACPPRFLTGASVGGP